MLHASGTSNLGAPAFRYNLIPVVANGAAMQHIGTLHNILKSTQTTSVEKPYLFHVVETFLVGFIKWEVKQKKAFDD